MFLFQLVKKKKEKKTELIERKILSDDFGIIEPSILNINYEIPIRSVIGDSQASAIAECCFKSGDCVITIGTGSFISVAIGNKPISSSNGNYPIAGFKFKNDKLYYLHSFVSTAGQSIDWARSIGLLNFLRKILTFYLLDLFNIF